MNEETALSPLSLTDLRLVNTIRSSSPAQKRSFPRELFEDRTDKYHENLFLDDMMDESSFHEDHRVKPSKRVKLEMETRLNLLDLPEEIICVIINFLTIPQVQNFRLCCKRLRNSVDKTIRLVVKINSIFKCETFKIWLKNCIMEVKFSGLLIQDKTIEGNEIESLLHLCGSQLNLFDLPYCWKLNNSVLESIGKYCGPSLNYLNLYNLNSITDEGIEKLAQSCPNLWSLDLGHCSRVTDVGLAFLAKFCKCLRKLDLSYCWNVSKSGIDTLRRSCYNISIITTGCRL